MEEQDEKNIKKKQKQSTEKDKHGEADELEKQLNHKSNPDMLDADKTAKKKAMAKAIADNMEAVKKSNE